MHAVIEHDACTLFSVIFIPVNAIGIYNHILYDAVYTF